MDDIIKIADQWGRERAHAETKTLARLEAATEKLAGFAESAGNLAKHVLKNKATTRMAVGAAAGAGANLIGNKDVGVGNTIGAAATGALAGRYAAPGVKRLAAHSSDAGKAFKKGLNSK